MRGSASTVMEKRADSVPSTAAVMDAAPVPSPSDTETIARPAVSVSDAGASGVAAACPDIRSCTQASFENALSVLFQSMSRSSSSASVHKGRSLKRISGSATIAASSVL